MRSILGSGKRDEREIETLGRSLRWTEEELEYEASDKRRQGLVEGVGLSEEEMLEGTEKTRFWSLAATLNFMSLDKSDVQYAVKDTHEDVEPDKRKLGEVEEGTHILEGSRDGDVGDAGVEIRPGPWMHTWLRTGQKGPRGS